MKSNCCFNLNLSPSASAPEPPSKSSPRASSSPTPVQHQINSMNNSHLNLDVHVSCSPTPVQPQMNLRAAFQEHSSPSLRPHTSTLQPESLEPMLSTSHRNSIPVRGHCNVDQVHVPIDQELHKEPCIVEGCKERIAPSMWLLHMTNHAKGGPFPHCGCGPSPVLSVLTSVLLLLILTYAKKCPSVAFGGQSQANDINVVPCSIPQHQATLPCLEEMCCLRHPTIRFVPSRARPAFARALSSVLKEIVAVNSVDAWTKLLMLPKCVLPTSKRGSRHNKPISIDILCDLWLKGNLCELWLFAQARATLTTQSKKVLSNKRVASAIALAKNALYGKPCQTLTSQGLAPDDDNNWNLLISKHPQGECPSNLPVPSTVTVLPPEFNIIPVLRSFSKLTGTGSTGLHIQHLIDAAEVPLSCSIVQSLKAVVNILAAGRAPPMIACFLAGGNFTALVKSQHGSTLDIRPIAVGEALHRLTGTCLCALVRSKASEFFQSYQFGVACPMGAEKIAHGLRAHVEMHWLEENFVVMKVDMKNAFNLVSRQAILSKCAKHFLNSTLGHIGVIASTHTYGIRWGI